MAAYNWKYAYTHPPFNWLGSFSKSQWTAFKSWAQDRQGDVASVSTFHRMRAQQLRKTAGALEQYYSTVHPKQPGNYGVELTPTFEKPVWQPGPYGHFDYNMGDDALPAVMVDRIKTQMREMLKTQDDAVYYMNQVRCLIEKHEDMAQFTNDFSQAPNSQTPAGIPVEPTTMTELLSKIDSYFSKPEYQNVLVDDTTLYKGQPYFRVHPADPPTIFELEQANHSLPTTPIQIADKGVINTSA